MQTPSPGAFVTPSPSGYSHAAPPALPYRAAAPARGPGAAHAATPNTHPVPSPTQTGAGSNQRWKFMDDTGKLRKVSGRLFSEPSATLRSVLYTGLQLMCKLYCKHHAADDTDEHKG